MAEVWHTFLLRFSFHVAALSAVVTTERRDPTLNGRMQDCSIFPPFFPNI